MFSGESAANMGLLSHFIQTRDRTNDPGHGEHDVSRSPLGKTEPHALTDESVGFLFLRGRIDNEEMRIQMMRQLPQHTNSRTEWPTTAISDGGCLRSKRAISARPQVERGFYPRAVLGGVGSG